jgi:EpsD family peptidyl-prolyl cis-trans isomerase
MALALVSALAVAGCGGKKDKDQAVTGQVIAHVGPDDITQQELDNELRLANIPQDKRTDAVMKAALTRIVERKYLVQQAMAAKLDREPTVHLDLLRAREQILGGAYVQRELGQKASGVSNSEVEAYIQGHADKFAKRQVFQIEQVTFPPQPGMEQLASAAKDFKTLDQVEAKLNELNIKFSRGPAALDSATLPSEMLKPIVARKPDDVFFVRSRNSASFFKVVSVEDKPLTGDQATAFAKRELRNEMARKASEDTVAAALASAKYEGDFGRLMTTAGSATPPGEASSAAEPASPGSPDKGEPDAKDAPKN